MSETRYFDFFKKLKVQLILPVIMLFGMILGSSVLIVLKLQKQEINFEKQSLLNSKVNKAVIRFNELRTNFKADILAYILTEDMRFLKSLNSIESVRIKEEDELFNFIENHPVFRGKISKIQQAYSSTLSLRKKIIEHVKKNDKKQAVEYYNVYTTMYDINSAQLIDIRNQLDAEILKSHLETKEFYKKLIVAAVLIILISTLIIVFSFGFYQFNLITPIRQLKIGLKEINRGIFPRIEGKKTTSFEIDEMLENFNKTSATLEMVEGELLQANQEALALAQVKTDFLSNMSHEIRTPLNSILGISELLGDYKHEEKVEKYHGIIRDNGKLLLSIVNDILDLSKLESGKIKLNESACNLNLLLDRVGSILEHAFIEKSLNFKMVISKDVPEFIICDDYRIEQILLNLLNNAKKFTDVGKVTVFVDLEDVKSQKMLSLKVQDTGIGISQENLKSLFERFTQADSGITKKYEGSGLGLSIVKQLVELMDGQTSVESELGKGSTFKVMIPLKNCTESQVIDERNIATQEVQQSLLGPITLLLVDDAKENRFLAKTFLQNLPITIIEAANGLEAVEAFKEHSCDFVLMDLQMPHMDGLQATIKIREYEKLNSLVPVPIIALSAYVQDEEIKKSKLAGCNSHLAKPVKRDTLISKVVTLANYRCLGRKGNSISDSNSMHT